MRLSRLFNSSRLHLNQSIILDKESSHYALKVLRLKINDTLILFDGRGGEYLSKITAINGPLAKAVPFEYLPSSRESTLKITLIQAISRTEPMDYTIQKAVELGVNKIIPFMSERSTVKLDSKRRLKKQIHWQNIIRSATEQCGRNIIANLEFINHITDFSEYFNPNDCKIILNPESKHTFHHIKKMDSLILLSGPEGGFSTREINTFRDYGFQEVSIGKRILRTETATITALSIAQFQWGDLSKVNTG